MPLTKRIIPCLDVKNGRTVKGINFSDLCDVGDPAELASHYAQQGADELVLLDITATSEKRKTLASLVSSVARYINIPFMVGGGIGSIYDVHLLLSAGADKVSVNTAAVNDPQLLYRLSSAFGSQCIVLAVDARFENGDWLVFTHGGNVRTEMKVSDWLKTAVSSGVGEILLTSINHDGTRKGFALQLLSDVVGGISIPVIASGGAGNYAHFAALFNQGIADAALAAGIFHNGEVNISELKTYLSDNNINIRL